MKEVRKIAQMYEKDLIELAEKLEKYYDGEIEEDPLDEFLDGVLDVKRVQALTENGWETTNYILCLGWGGPGIWLETGNYVIEVAWGGDHVRWVVFDERARKAIDEIHEHLEEIEG